MDGLLPLILCSITITLLALSSDIVIITMSSFRGFYILIFLSFIMEQQKMTFFYLFIFDSVCVSGMLHIVWHIGDKTDLISQKMSKIQYKGNTLVSSGLTSRLIPYGLRWQMRYSRTYICLGVTQWKEMAQSLQQPIPSSSSQYWYFQYQLSLGICPEKDPCHYLEIIFH